MRILLIEADAALAQLIQAELQRAHFTVDTAADGETGLRRVRQGAYALIVLDVMLPERDGFSICEALRTRRDTVPVLMLTAGAGLEDRVRAFECGADASLPKPVDRQELLARVRVLLRRDKIHKARMIRIADLEIDTWTRRVRRRGQERFLTPREFALLEALAVDEGRTLTREMILEHVWVDGACSPETVNFHIASLRRKIEDGRDIRLIHTVHGVGYVLRGPESEVMR
jgi:DNA-binding response OmpR family regulator